MPIFGKCYPRGYLKYAGHTQFRELICKAEIDRSKLIPIKRIEEKLAAETKERTKQQNKNLDEAYKKDLEKVKADKEKPDMVIETPPPPIVTEGSIDESTSPGFDPADLMMYVEQKDGNRKLVFPFQMPHQESFIARPQPSSLLYERR